MIKLVIQIPCLNEAETLEETVRDIPRAIPGVDVVELLVVDDGSTDGTAEVARALGIEHVVRFRTNRGLARAFLTGLDTALRAGADIVVNTDADNQYKGEHIPRLIEPILAGRADVVVGDRQTDQIAHFTPIKRFLQRWGTWGVRLISGTSVTDATSGFRAYNRESAMRLMVYSRFSYTLETILQAGMDGLAIETVRVGINPPTRKSRLFKTIPQYLRKSAEILIRIYSMYNPMRLYVLVGFLFLAAGTALGMRFVVLWAIGAGGGKIQSLILTAVLVLAGVQVCLIGMLADVIANNRKLLEDILLRIKQLEYGRHESHHPGPLGAVPPEAAMVGSPLTPAPVEAAASGPAARPAEPVSEGAATSAEASGAARVEEDAVPSTTPSGLADEAAQRDASGGA